jgi:hypothetical protein
VHHERATCSDGNGTCLRWWVVSADANYNITKEFYG